MQQQMACNLFPVHECPLEHKRLYAMNLWILSYHQFNWTSFGNLTHALDWVIADSSYAYSSSVSRLQEVSFKIGSNNSYEINLFGFGRQFVRDIAVNTTYYCFVSPNLSLTMRCRIVRRNEELVFEQVVVVFRFPSLNAREFPFRNFNSSEFINR